MRAMPVIAMLPSWQVGLALLGAFEGGGVRPFSERSLNETLSLAVSLRRIGFGAQMFDAKLLARVTPEMGFVAAAVVCHDACDGDAEARVIGNGCLEECDGTSFPFAFFDGAERDAGVIVDSDMNILPSLRSVCFAIALLGCAIACYTVSHAIETAEFLDVDVNDLAGRGAFIARPWWLWLKG